MKTSSEKVLIVEDEELNRLALAGSLRSWGYEALEADTCAGALALFDAEHPSAVLLDINLPDGSGIDVLRDLKTRQPEAVIIMITGNVLVGDTIAALRGGAYDFIGKPINLDELQVTIRNGIEARRLRREVAVLHEKEAHMFGFDRIVGRSPAMQQTLALALRVAESEASTVLLQGESGTGKDILAKAIHYASRRAGQPFIAINCAALPANLIESELFGYEKGAFTDARSRKEGLMEQAEGGTLFLDEIGELELSLQAKLLRVIDEGSFRRVGGLKDIPLDARVIAASNRNLKVELKEERFRLDLYYRLSVMQIDIPPLRERGEDVLLVADHFITQLNERLRKRVGGLSPEVAAAFRRYDWPGNVRELRNVIERSMILENGDLITMKYLPPGLTRDGGARRAGEDSASSSGLAKILSISLEDISLDEVERALVRRAMAESGGNQTRAARLLGISREQLRYRLKKLEE